MGGGGDSNFSARANQLDLNLVVLAPWMVVQSIISFGAQGGWPE